MPGLHIDEVGGGESLSGAPVLNIQELAELPQAELKPFERRLVEIKKQDYIYLPEAVKGDVAPSDQSNNTGFWVVFYEELWKLKISTEGEDNYELRYYEGENTQGVYGGNIIMGFSNSLGNGFENLLLSDNTRLHAYAWRNLVIGNQNDIEGAVRCLIVGDYNTLRNYPNDGIVIGANNEEETFASAIFGSLNKNLQADDINGEGAWNLIAGNRNELIGGRACLVVGKDNDLGDIGRTMDGVNVMGIACDMDFILNELNLEPLLLLGNGEFNFSQKELIERSNAFLVAKSGEVIAFDLTIDKITNSPSDKILVTKEYLNTVIGMPIRLKNQSLTAANWSLNEASGLWEYPFASQRLTNSTEIEFIPHQESVDVVSEAGIQAYTPIQNGTALIRSINEPAEDITVDIIITTVKDV